MHKWLALLVTFVSAHLGGGLAAAGTLSEPDDHRQWLMLVMTQNTDPARDAEFNDWYDHVDIPEVLQVPGYRRARRAREESAAESLASKSASGPLKYLALYDIDSHDIDKTIIDMLMASWGMEKSHHSTDLLRVTERVYYRQYGPAFASSAAASPAGNTYVFMTRFDCCHDAVAARRFDRWYERRWVPARLASPGILSVARYELYRVLMEKPVPLPEFMTIEEVEADSAEHAEESMNRLLRRVSGTDRDGGPYAAVDRSVFLLINDVKRP